MQDLVESFSGIRGVYGKSITADLARKYALCYCNLFKGELSKLVVGGDTRHSTPELKKAMIDIFKEQGIGQIIDVGIVPVQVAEYAILKFSVDGGVYISASHNEPEYNGFKFLKEDGALLYPKQAEQLIEMAHSFKGGKVEGRNKQLKTEIIDKQEEAIQNYIDFILEKIGTDDLEKINACNFKILVDPNGGSAINVLGRLFKEMAIEAEIINNQLGGFNRLIEPNVKSLASLAEKLKGDEFEFACGFDCDADRVEFVISPDSDFAQKMGSPALSGNYVLALACDALLQDTTGQVIVVNDATSYLVRDVVKKHGAKIKEVEVGEMPVVIEMERQRSIIGGEGSNGGVIIPPIKCRDGIMTVVLILKMLAEKQESLLEILDGYPKYYSEREKIYCPSEQTSEIKIRVENYFSEQDRQIQKTGDKTGGMKVRIGNDTYIFFRQSKTEPCTLRIIADGNNKEKVKRLLKQGVEAFNKFKK